MITREELEVALQSGFWTNAAWISPTGDLWPAAAISAARGFRTFRDNEEYVDWEDNNRDAADKDDSPGAIYEELDDWFRNEYNVHYDEVLEVNEEDEGDTRQRGRQMIAEWLGRNPECLLEKS